MAKYQTKLNTTKFLEGMVILTHRYFIGGGGIYVNDELIDKIVQYIVYIVNSQEEDITKYKKLFIIYFYKDVIFQNIYPNINLLDTFTHFGND